MENKIRDKLIQKLEVIDDDLTPIDKEVYLPNEKGTRSFVDILAKDSKARYVLIELKRSNASSREAIHEVFKYVEAIKANKSLKDDEICVLVVSTEWDELIIPFSSFVDHVSYSVKGYRLEIDKDYNPLKAELVAPVKLKNERLLSDIHGMKLYTSKEKLEEGIESHKQCFQEKGIDDYVLLILKADPNHRELEIQSTLQGLKDIAERFGKEPEHDYTSLSELMPNYQYIIYSSAQLLDEQIAWSIIQKNEALYEEVKDIIEDYGPEKIPELLHDNAVYSCGPTPFSEYVEIGYPAKLRGKLLDTENWTIEKLIRSGKIKENEILTDETIINELCGDRGTNKQSYFKEYKSVDKASISQVRKEVKVCLSDNEIWLAGVNKALDEIEKSETLDNKELIVRVFNPSNTVLSLYQSAISGEPSKHMPYYTIILKSADLVETYLGCYKRNISKIKLEKFFKKAYDGGETEYLTSLLWGGYQANDSYVSHYLGLEYANYKIISSADETVCYYFDGFKFSETELINPDFIFYDYLSDHEELVNTIVEFFESKTLTPGLFEF